MPLTHEALTALLNRAIRLESRSFLEYIAQTATPVDLHKYPDVARGLAEIAYEEDEVVDELVEALEQRGVHADALGSYDLTFTYYNYMSTDFALKTIEQRLAKNVEKFDEIVAGAKGDPLEARLRELRERKAHQVHRVQNMRAALKAPPKPAAPAPAAAPASGAAHAPAPPAAPPTAVHGH